MRFKFQGHILRPIEGTGPSPVSPLTCTLTGSSTIPVTYVITSSGDNNKGPVSVVELRNTNWSR